MDLNANLIDEGFLASTADLAGLLAQMPGQGGRRSSRMRTEGIELVEAMFRASGNAATDEPPATITAPRPLGGAPTVGRIAPTAAMEKILNSAPVSRIKRHENCKCGNCKWCLENARWERIYAEKFADPSYYAGVSIRHNSTLAPAR
jgi:hypothetical protein